jgi:hypothetical protein
MKVKTRGALVLIAALAVALPPTAQAALPKPASKLIVPRKSIGGVALGASPSRVQKAWGANPDCEYSCIYTNAAQPAGSAAFAIVLLEAKKQGATPKAWSVAIGVGQKTVGNRTVPNFKTPLKKWETAKGIHLGSTKAQLKHAYHGVKNEGSASGYTTFELKGPGKVETLFTVAPAGKISRIEVRSHPGG